MNRSDENPANTFSRRIFAQRMALGIGGLTTAQTTWAAAEPPAEPRPPSAAELILLQVVAQCPSDQWTDELLSLVLADIEGDLARSRRLRGVLLTNGDEPATIFPSIV